MESLTRVSGGDSVDITHLLPPFARQRLYTYPHPDQAAELKQDCWWTALNFFNETPDDHFPDPAVVMQTLKADYQPLGHDQTARFGDLVIFFDPGNQPVHVSVFIADDIVFTKDGSNLSSPWILRDQPSLLDLYSAVTPGGQTPRSVTVRHKDDAGVTLDAGP